MTKTRTPSRNPNRARITVDPAGNWRLYAPILPAGCTALGVVTRGTDVGALFVTRAGVYALCNAGLISALDQRKARAALREVGALPDNRGGPREGAGRPAIGRSYTIKLDDASAAALRGLGVGNLSEGIREAARRVIAAPETI